jgi:negative regulator of replication initiation
MSSCSGEIPTGTKVDAEMREFIDAETDRLGISKSEFHRRLLESYRDSRREQLDCPHCEKTIVMDLTALQS